MGGSTVSPSQASSFLVLDVARQMSRGAGFIRPALCDLGVIGPHEPSLGLGLERHLDPGALLSHPLGDPGLLLRAQVAAQGLDLVDHLLLILGTGDASFWKDATRRWLTRVGARRRNPPARILGVDGADLRRAGVAPSPAAALD